MDKTQIFTIMKLLILWIGLLFSTRVFAQTPQSFDIQGHGGARGLMPENTIPAFLKALELGVDTLEMDVVVSRDKQLVVSHDPYFSAAISLDKKGRPIPAQKQTETNLFKMDYSQIKTFDVGSLGNRNFPEQRKMKTHKPLLRDVFTETQKYIRSHKLKPTMYSIEAKSTPQGDNLFHPKPAVFARLLYNEIIRNKMQKRVIIQSFDVRILQEFRKFAVRLPLSLLVANLDGFKKNIEKLGFRPNVYSPYYLLVDDPTVELCRAEGIKIVPWTVNEISDLQWMKRFGLDGIITDYPDRAIKVFRK